MVGIARKCSQLIIIVRGKELFPAQEAVIQWANPICGLLRPCSGSAADSENKLMQEYTNLTEFIVCMGIEEPKEREIHNERW